MWIILASFACIAQGWCVGWHALVLVGRLGRLKSYRLSCGKEDGYHPADSHVRSNTAGRGTDGEVQLQQLGT